MDPHNFNTIQTNIVVQPFHVKQNDSLNDSFQSIKDSQQNLKVKKRNPMFRSIQLPESLDQKQISTRQTSVYQDNEQSNFKLYDASIFTRSPNQSTQFPNIMAQNSTVRGHSLRQSNLNHSFIEDIQNSNDKVKMPVSQLFNQTHLQFSRQKHQQLQHENQKYAPKVQLDYPRQIRLSNKNETIYQMRQTLRKNRIFHTSYDVNLENMKSKLLLNGIYEPNIPDSFQDTQELVTDHIKERGNYKKEIVKICEIYDSQQAFKDSKKKVLQKLEQVSSKDQASKRAKIEYKEFMSKLLSENAYRNETLTPISDEDESKPKIEIPPIQLSFDAQRTINDMIQKKNEMIEINMHKSFQSQVKKIERLLDDGFIIEIPEEFKQKSPIKAQALQNQDHIKSNKSIILLTSSFTNNQISDSSKQSITTVNSNKNQAFDFGKQQTLRKGLVWRQKLDKKRDTLIMNKRLNSQESSQNNKMEIGKITSINVKEFSDQYNHNRLKNQLDNEQIYSRDSLTIEENLEVCDKVRYKDIQKEKLTLDQEQIQDQIQRFLHKTQKIKIPNSDDLKLEQNVTQNSSRRYHNSMDLRNQNKNLQIPLEKKLHRNTMSLSMRQSNQFSTQDTNLCINNKSSSLRNDSRNLKNKILNVPSAIDSLKQKLQSRHSRHQLRSLQQSEIKKIIEECKQTEKDKSQILLGKQIDNELLQVEQTEDRIAKAIDSYQESFISVIKQTKNDKALFCNDIIIEQIQEDGENFDNFLSPAYIKQLREDKISLIKSSLFGKKSTIWKPTKYEFPKHIREVLHSQRENIY